MMNVIDTPLAESNIIGTAIGAAMLGKRPIAEIICRFHFACYKSNYK